MMIPEVLKRIKPTDSERRRLKKTADRMIELVEEAAKELNVDAKAILVGSTARNTWLSGEKDIDVFILFPESYTNDELESTGMAIAKRITKDYEERYAEHPYARMEFDGYDIDLVPCFSVKEPTSIKSAVDRTPFHNEYMKRNIVGIEDEVLLLKQFMRGIGVYGAELKVQGFSGFLCELLILRYRSFDDVLRNASDWRRGEVIDIEGHGDYGRFDPLIVIDPTDPRRNVAAAVSIDSFSIFIHKSRNFLERSDIHYFFPTQSRPISKDELMMKINERETDMITINFDLPDIVDDILFPQLYKAERSIVNMLERNNFSVLRSGVWSKNCKGVILLEMRVSKLPKIKKHTGPPVTSKHSERFIQRHEKERIYIEDGRYIAEINRKYEEARDLLMERIVSCRLGKNIRASIEKGKILENDGIILFDGFDVFMRDYFAGVG